MNETQLFEQIGRQHITIQALQGDLRAVLNVIVQLQAGALDLGRLEADLAAMSLRIRPAAATAADHVLNLPPPPITEHP